MLWTTGGSILQALDIITKTGARTVAAATLVDRGDSACQKFEAAEFRNFPRATHESLRIEPGRLAPIVAAADR